MSPAESTMNHYAPTAPTDPNIPNPIDPITGHRSPFPSGFNGCMLCGSRKHIFQGCPNRHQPGSKSAFFRNLFAHKPHLRKNPPKPREIVPGFVPASQHTHPSQAFAMHTPTPPVPGPNSGTSLALPAPVGHLFVIEVPPKIWQPKPVDRYRPLDYSNDIDHGVFLFKRYDKAMRKS